MQKSLPNIVASAAFLILGVFWLMTSFSLPAGSGTSVYGNSRTFPQIIAAIIIIVATIQLIGQIRTAVKSPGKEDKAEDISAAASRQMLVNAIGLIAVTLLYILSVNLLTYLPATILLLGATMWIFGVRKKGIFLSVAVLFPAVLLVVFRYLLVVPLP